MFGGNLYAKLTSGSPGDRGKYGAFFEHDLPRNRLSSTTDRTIAVIAILEVSSAPTSLGTRD